MVPLSIRRCLGELRPKFFVFALCCATLKLFCNPDTICLCVGRRVTHFSCSSVCVWETCGNTHCWCVPPSPLLSLPFLFAFPPLLPANTIGFYYPFVINFSSVECFFKKNFFKGLRHAAFFIMWNLIPKLKLKVLSCPFLSLLKAGRVWLKRRVSVCGREAKALKERYP